MNPDRDDPLMDACLEEVLGGIRPPDLRARIVRAWAIRQQELTRAADGTLVPASGANILELPEVDAPSAPQQPMVPPMAQLAGQQPVAQTNGWSSAPAPLAQPALGAALRPIPVSQITAQPATGQPTTAQPASPAPIPQAATPETSDGGLSIRPASPRDRSETPWWTVVVALSMLAAGGLVGLLAGRNWGTVANKDPNPGTNPNLAGPNTPGSATAGPSIPLVNPELNPKKPNPVAVLPEKKTAPVALPSFPEKNPFGDNPQKNLPLVNRNDKPVPAYVAPKNPLPDAEVIASVNAWLSGGWQQNGIEPAGQAREEDWLLRTTRVVLGRDPNGAEKAQFVAMRPASRRSEWVARLLSEGKYSDEFAKHWAGYFSRVLLGPDDGQKSLANRAGLEDYLRQSIRSGKPMADVAGELLSATGSGRPGSPGYNGAANFLLASCGDVFQSEATAAERTARGMLGIRLDCARCHSHADGKFSQEQFWQFAACFGPIKAEENGNESKLVVGPPADLNWETVDGEARSSSPKFLDGSSATAEGKGQLGQLVGRSEQFSKAMVNRVWGQFTGYGFVNPVDDFGPHNPPSHPELLETLAAQFAAHGHDLKALVRWVALSDACNRGDREFLRNEPDLPEVGTPPLFSRRYDRPKVMKPLADTLVDLSHNQNRKLDLASSLAPVLPSRWGPKPELQIVDTSVPPTLPKSVKKSAKEWVARILASQLTTSEQVEHVFMATLGRKPSYSEADAASGMLESSLGEADRQAALEQLWWTVRFSATREE